jgi:hypothetical protein
MAEIIFSAYSVNIKCYRGYGTMVVHRPSKSGDGGSNPSISIKYRLCGVMEARLPLKLSDLVQIEAES